MRSLLVCIGLMVFAAGCANTVRIVTMPSSAKVYHNGDFVGNSPVSIKQEGYDAISLVIEKPGYRTLNRTINVSEISSKYHNSDFKHGSEFGHGNTYTFTIPLEPIEPNAAKE